MNSRIGFLAGLSLLTGLTLAGPAFAGPPFITDDPEPVDLGHWEVYGFSAGAQAMAIPRHAGPSLEVNYGAAPGLQLHVIGGFAYDDQPGGHLQMGPSDTELGAKLRFIKPEKTTGIRKSAFFRWSKSRQAMRSADWARANWQEFLPLWLQKDWGNWTTYGGGGYWINPGPGNQNYWFVGWLLQRKVTESLALGGEFSPDRQYGGTKRRPRFNVGGEYDFTEHYHLLFSAGRGGIIYAVDGPAVGYPTTYYLAYQWTS